MQPYNLSLTGSPPNRGEDLDEVHHQNPKTFLKRSLGLHCADSNDDTKIDRVMMITNACKHGGGFNKLYTVWDKRFYGYNRNKR